MRQRWDNKDETGTIGLWGGPGAAAGSRSTRLVPARVGPSRFYPALPGPACLTT